MAPQSNWSIKRVSVQTWKYTCHTHNCLNCPDLPRKLTTVGVKQPSHYYSMALSFFLPSIPWWTTSFFLIFFFLIRARQLKPQLLFLRRGRCGRQMAEVQKASTRILLAGQEWSLTFVGKDASMWSAYTTMLPVHCSFTTLLCPYFFFFLTEHHECL